METNTIIIIGFIAVLVLLWQMLGKLTEINLRSEQTSKHLFQIENKMKNETDLSGIEDHLKKIYGNLESVESSVDVIKDEISNKEA